MHRLLIPSLACLFFLCTPALLRAQVPHEIQYAPYDPSKVTVNAALAEMPCGSAGTFTFGQFLGFSNDVGGQPIFLCFGDSLQILHDGNADLSGDPNPATPPGIGFAFYDCAPTIQGPTLQNVIGSALPPLAGDPCLTSTPPPMNGLYITQPFSNGGSTWFFNSGGLQTTFNMGLPISLFFAPITVDVLAGNGYESTGGSAPGPCVAVNTAAAFEVVYLNQITATGINDSLGNDCVGRFTARGGFPQYALGVGLYTIDISLASNPGIKAIIHTPRSAMFHQSSIAFSVPQPGVYNVTIEDGKSCPASLQIDMSGCNPVDNLTMVFPDTIVPPGNTICIPVTVDNFDILSGSFSMEWNETVLQYNGLQNIHPAIDSLFSPGANLNTQQVVNGNLGFTIFNNQSVGTNILIPNGSVLFEMCFTAVGQLGDCSGLGVTNSPTGVSLEGNVGQNVAISVDTGQVCIAFLPLTFTFAVIDTNCLGQATLIITPSGGVEPYEVVVDESSPAGPGPTYSGLVLSPGEFFTVMDVGSTNNTPVTYDICVQDNNGQGAIQCTTIVVDIKRLGAQINFVQQPLCNAGSTGIVSATVLEGGISVPNPGTNYTFAWSPANVPSPGSQVQNGVTAGLYTVTVTNLSTGCSEVASGSLGQPAPLSSQSVTNTPASCTGVCDGTITYDAEGGTPFAGPAYQYTWIYEDTNTPVGSGTGNPIVLTNACAGEYSMVLTDANGCVLVDSNLVLNNLRSLNIVQNTVTTVACFGASTGAINITVTESVPTGSNYTFNWTPAGFTQGGISPMSSYSGLPIGTYVVVAADNLGCQAMDTILITQPDSIRIDSFGQINPGCAQPNSGSISIQVFGGTGLGTYQFAWNPPATNVQNPMGLPFGTYAVTVTDGNMCTKTRQFVLREPVPPVVTITQTAVQCGPDGALTANAPTGIVYVWTDINGIVIDSLPSIDSLMGGQYIVKVFDDRGCLTLDTVTLTGVTPMSFSNTTLQEPTCFGFNNGQIAIGVQDGQVPYVGYDWAPATVMPPNSPVISALTAGSYTVTVTDNVGCTLVGTFVLDQPPAIVNAFDPTVMGQVSCFGINPCDGEATAITAYSNGPGNFTYLWSDGSPDSIRTDLCAGLNFVTISDANNCGIVDTIEITTPPQITAANLVTTETFCFGDSTGSASLSAAGGNGGPYLYLWNTGAVTPGINGVPAGNYTVTLTDVDGCTNSINTIAIGEPDPIVLATSSEDPDCFGRETGQTTVTVSGGVPSYIFIWEDDMGNNVGNADMAEMLKAGTYFVTVTDANGCTALTNSTIQDPPPVMGDYEDFAALNCFGDETIFRISSISGGSGGPYKFSVDFGAILDPSFPVSIGGGEHFITYIDFKGCQITEMITVAEPLPITVTFDPNVIEVELGATADLSPIVTGTAFIADIIWTNSATLLNPDTLNATAYTFDNETYTLTVVDSFGCSGVGTVMVTVDPNRNVYIPNIFAPANPTGLNDHFNVNTGLGVKEVNFMRIYDRWGGLIYERERFLPNNDNLGEGWNGRHKGDFVNPGVFVYLVEVKFLDGRVLLYRGDVTVVR